VQVTFYGFTEVCYLQTGFLWHLGDKEKTHKTVRHHEQQQSLLDSEHEEDSEIPHLIPAGRKR